MSDGQILVDSDGRETIDPDGNGIVSNGTDDSDCCCGSCDCPLCAGGACSFDVTFDGVDGCGTCVPFFAPFVQDGITYFAQKVTGSIDGTYTLPLDDSSYNFCSFRLVVPNPLTLTLYTDLDCTAGAAARTDLPDMVILCVISNPGGPTTGAMAVQAWLSPAGGGGTSTSRFTFYGQDGWSNEDEIPYVFDCDEPISLSNQLICGSGAGNANTSGGTSLAVRS